MIYALYRPLDNEEVPNDAPTFAKEFFWYLESFFTVPKMTDSSGSGKEEDLQNNQNPIKN